jgi:hypothetical protein
MHNDRFARIFVLTIFAFMMGFALLNIAKYGRNIPLAEDWALVDPLTGNEPNFAEWLWVQNNEHRIPVPKLLLLALLKITHGDFRAGMYFNTIILGLLSIFMILVARQLRQGSTGFADAFFPIALLNLGNWENLAWSWQLGFVLPTVLSCAALLLILMNPSLSTITIAVVAGACVVLLPLCGANGLLYTPFFALWLFYCGILNLRLKPKFSRHRLISAVLIISASTAIVLTCLYFVGYESPPWYPHSPNIWATIVTAAKFQALGLGPAVKKFWNLSIIMVTGFLLLTAFIATLGIFRNKGLDRNRALGVFLFLGTTSAFALAMGWGRAAIAPTSGLPMRYVLLAVPAFCASYFIWELYGPTKLRSIAQISLLLGCLTLLPFNTKAGFEWRDWYASGMNNVERDILSGTPPSILAERHKSFLVHWWSNKRLNSAMNMLHKAKIGPFSNMKTEEQDEMSTTQLKR